MQTRLLPLLALGLVLSAGPADAQFVPRAPLVPPENYHVELALLWWEPTPALSLTTDAADLGRVDFVQEFGITEEQFREFRAVLKPARRHKIRFSRLPIRYDQDAQLQRTITFGGRTFPVNVAANAAIDWDLYRIGYEWDPVSRSHGYIGIIGELKYNKVKADITSDVGSAGTEQRAPVPTIGGIARAYLGNYLSVTTEFTGLKLDGESFRGKFYDFDVYGAAHLGAHLGVQAGYRKVTVDYLVDEDEGTMELKGPYFGGFIRF